jgi:ribonuclease HI
MPDFQCAGCGQTFSLSAEVLNRYPGWTPRQCRRCKAAADPRSTPKGKAGQGGAPSGGPNEGLFTDGACSGNPGPGGWGVVWVRDGGVIAEANGGEPHTTNNRMELTALIEAYRMLDTGSTETIYSDSTLCVKTVNEWAQAWERQGWKRKTGPVENLDLVKPLYELARAHPDVQLRWLKGHAGQRWNERADVLATTYQQGIALVQPG